MIMMYDGNKVFFLESVEKDTPLTTQLFYNLVNNKAILETILVECAVVTNKDGSMATLFNVPYGTVEADKHVLLDYSKINAVWTREISEEERKSFDLMPKFVDPIQEKFTKLMEEMANKEQAAHNAKVVESVNALIAKARATTKQAGELPEANQELVAVMGGDVGFTTAPATAMPEGSVPAFGTPANASESLAVNAVTQIEVPNK